MGVLLPRQISAAGTDLVVTGVGAPAYAHPYGTIRAGAVVEARNAAAGASSLRFYLSRDRARDQADLPLGGGAAVPRLDAGQAYPLAAVAALPGSLEPGRFFLLACADDRRQVPESDERNNCAASAASFRVTATPVTTDDLLDAAVKRGEISAETALVYRVFAAFGDPRVPAKYLGDDGPVAGDDILQRVLDAWSTLSESTRAQLAPFFSPPAARGRWANGGGAVAATGLASADLAAASPPCVKDKLPDAKWQYVDTNNGRFRIWWAKEGFLWFRYRDKAIAFKEAIDEKIFPKLSELFWPIEPLSDDGVECFNGGDGRIDVYLAPIPTDAFRVSSNAIGLAVPYGRCPTPVYLVVDPSWSEFTLAHEVTHAFQYAHEYKRSCSTYRGFWEGSAEWGAHYVYPRHPEEYWFLDLLKDPALHFPDLKYPGWVFDLFLEKTAGADTIAKVFRAFKDHDVMSGIDSVVPGGLAQTWPEFAKFGWNQAPLNDEGLPEDAFGKWEDIPTAPETRPIELSLDGAAQRKVDLPVRIQDLTRKYYVADVVDENVRWLLFKNDLFGKPGAAVQAFVQFTDGTWQYRDWTGEKQVELCRDEPGEEVQRLVVLYSNSDWAGQGTLSGRPALTLASSCYFYRALGGGFTYTTTATAHGQAVVYCKELGIRASDSLARKLVAPARDIFPLRFDPLAGQLSGAVQPRMPAKFTDVNRGCTKTDDGKEMSCGPLTSTYKPQPDGTWPAGFYLARGKGKRTVKLQWTVGSPEVGYVNPDDSVCNVYPVTADSTRLFSESMETVSFDRFRSVDPFTLSFSGTFHFTSDASGNPIDMVHTWRLRLTLVRVDVDGHVLRPR